MNTDPGIKLARIASSMAIAASLDETPAPCGPELDEPARAKHHGRCKGRAYTKCDHRAFEKRVAKRRAKKGYA